MFGFSQTKIDKTKCCVSYVYLCISLICFYCRLLQMLIQKYQRKEIENERKRNPRMRMRIVCPFASFVGEAKDCLATMT